MEIIGLVGKAGSGKSTVAKFILEEKGRVKLIGLADPLKRFCKDIFQFTDEELWGDSKYRYKLNWRVKPDGEYLTAREALQKLGTEYGRALYPDVWIDYGLARAAEVLDGSRVVTTYNASSPVHSLELFTLVVFPDVRFINEMRRIREAGGCVWRIAHSPSLFTGNHASETELESAEAGQYFDYIIPYTPDPETRRTHVRQALDAFEKRGTMPYKSDAQRKKFHAMAARGEISKDVVAEFDAASKGKKLPKKVAKKPARKAARK